MDIDMVKWRNQLKAQDFDTSDEEREADQATQEMWERDNDPLYQDAPEPSSTFGDQY